MTNLDTEIGANVNDVMFRQHISQAQMAEALGCSASTVSMKLHGKRKWTLTEIYAAAKVLNVDVAAILPESSSDNGQYHAGHLAA